MAREVEASTPSPAPGGQPAWRPLLAMGLAWMVPGAGHLYLGRPRRAALYAFLVLFMLAFGLHLEGGLSRPRPGELLSVLASLADAGTGLVYFVLHALDVGAGRAASATHEYGNTFHWSAGILNMLLVLDAHDIAHGKK